MSRKLLGKDLKIGMLTTDGFLFRVDLKGTGKGVWRNKPSIHFFEARDSYYGGVSRELLLEKEYEILFERETEEYNDFLQSVISDRVDYICDAERDVDLIRAYQQTRAHKEDK